MNARRTYYLKFRNHTGNDGSSVVIKENENGMLVSNYSVYLTPISNIKLLRDLMSYRFNC